MAIGVTHLFDEFLITAAYGSGDPLFIRILRFTNLGSGLELGKDRFSYSTFRSTPCI